jgi:HNH endonuclease
VLTDESLDHGDFEATLDALCASLEEREAHEVRVAITSVVARLVEARLLGDEQLRQIARYPSVYLGRARSIVERRVAELGLDGCISDADIRYLATLLTSGVPHSATDAAVGSDLVSALFRQARSLGRTELRCGICGFHFRKEDLPAGRLELARPFEFLYASTLDRRRVADPLKPSSRTMLHVDHVVPRAGWGPTRLSNLEFLCEFCNLGKLAFRRGLENLSGFAAGGVPPLDRAPADWAVRQTVVGAIMTTKRCAICGTTSSDHELTAVAPHEWFVPWTLEVRCYNCTDRPCAASQMLDGM